MKKALLFVFAVFTVLTMLFVAITPVAAKGGEKSITLVSALYIRGKGIVFKFKVVGEFKGFSGQAFAGGQKFALDCKLNDAGDLACLAESGMKKFIGQTVSANVNGYTGSVRLRNSRYCYPVYDWVPGLDPLGPSPIDPAQWTAFTSFCQNDPAESNDLALLPNPAYPQEPFWYYYYQPDLSVCFPPLPFGGGYALNCFK
jgi:hypothetical protein